MKRLRAGILGATGMVGQRFVTLLQEHPLFDITLLAASERSAGQSYRQAVSGRWRINEPMPANLADAVVQRVQDVEAIAAQVDFVFCALDLDKGQIQEIENAYAGKGIPVVSNNSAHRWTVDVPMIIPEVNPDHCALIEVQRRNRGWQKGFIAVKPNCSLQSYVPALAALREFEPQQVFVTTLQAISGSGRTLLQAPEIADNIIPLPGEEEKSEREPLKILGSLGSAGVTPAPLRISAHCNRVAAEDGHMAVVSVQFGKKPSVQQIRDAWAKWNPEPQALGLPSAPRPCLIYVEGEDRPQTRLDRDNGKGMAISVGRLRPCSLLDFRFMALSHNTIRGAAGGAILTAELLHQRGYL